MIDDRNLCLCGHDEGDHIDPRFNAGICACVVCQGKCDAFASHDALDRDLEAQEMLDEMRATRKPEG